ncbi:MAG: hypothetical protein PHW05_00070 [Tepidiphilus sp.]|jgi:hypothetical protein|nr:hypothetical protein [Tepidiphilus sp.]
MDTTLWFRRLTALFWLAFTGLILLDALTAHRYRPEPPPIALGSGQAPSGGHCSGR